MNQLISYRTGDWDYEQLGNHRAVVRILPASAEAAPQAVRVVIPWRRRDAQPEAKHTIVTDEAGNTVANVIRLKVNREQGEFVFQPVSGPGLYYIYYMPYTGTTRAPYPQIEYLSPVDTADPAWRSAWSDATLPEAELVEIQAIDEYHCFYPMEVIATQAEIESLVSRCADRPFLVFPEDRAYPIRMTRDLPQRWVEKGPAGFLQGRASRGEFYAFQLGVWAFHQPLTDLQVQFRDLSRADGDETIPNSAFRCFNLAGIDWTGKPFQKAVSVEQGCVQALWCGVQISEDCAPGNYRAQVAISAAGAESQIVELRLEIQPEVIPAAGDDEPWRHARLRWLDSTLALDDAVVKPFTPVQVEGDVLKILGRAVRLGADGLPTQITSFFSPEVTTVTQQGREILVRPIRLVVAGQDQRPLDWQVTPAQIIRQAEGVVGWRSRWQAGVLSVDLTAELEFDGNLEFTLALSSGESTPVNDIRLEIPFHKEAARYMMGLGITGGFRPETVRWKWNVAHKNQDSAWLGDVNAGLQFTLKDEHYARPLNTNYYLLKPLVEPVSWANGGRGEVTISASGSEVVAVCASGERVLQAGEVLYFNFRLAITPFKPVDTEAQWSTRFYHRYRPVDEVIAEGANTINIHHANEINPFINYPFLTPEKMKDYVDQGHARGLRVKFYYTVRELTNHAPEIYALRSLGDEILSDGPGGGHSWLREHLVDHYIPGWHVFPIRDVAVINSGTSRWHNFYLEGLDWLARNIGIDGIYIDDLAFDRVVMKRMRKILDRRRPDALIDLHSANQFRERDGYANSANLYLEHFPYLNRLWFGEYFDYNLSPDFWLVEVSGIPFGLMGEMLQDGGNPWRGMLYGMTCRLPHSGDPRPAWRLWNDFGMAGTQMYGYWSPNCPARTDHPQVLATVYAKEGGALIALASWAPEPVSVRLSIDWASLGLDPHHAVLRAVASEGFQPEAQFQPEDAIPVEPGKGWLLKVEQR